MRFAFFLIALFVPMVASAQPAPVTPTPSQVQLYTRARVAFDADHYDEAIELLNEALEQGEVNLLLLSLGRALFRAGQCEGADDAYTRALVAPYVDRPSRSEVAATVESYRDDLAARCPGQIVVACDQEGIRFRIDNGEERGCDSPPEEVPAGRHLVETTTGDRHVVMVEAMRTASVRLGEPPRPVAPPPPRDRGGSTELTVGWIALAGGVAALAVAFTVDVAVLGPAIDDFEVSARHGDGMANDLLGDVDTLRPIVFTTYVIGALATGVGAFFLLNHYLDDGEEAPVQAAIGPGNVEIRGRF